MKVHEFSHEAMATTFHIAITCHEVDYARQAANAAFRELDQLEIDLSRFVENSDIARIARLADGESLVVGEHALQSVLCAMRFSALTARAFDPTYRSATAASASDAPRLAIDPANHRITALVAPVQLDLGAVGKGYALDCLMQLLHDWEIMSACLDAGGSSVVAYHAAQEVQNPWNAQIASRCVQLGSQAVSASGLSVQGAHIIDPRTGAPALRTGRVWAFAPTAAEADALSTAFFVMSDEDIAAYCRSHLATGAAVLRADGLLHFQGRCPPFIN